MDTMKKQTDFELIFVDDGSSDRTYKVMKELHSLQIKSQG